MPRRPPPLPDGLAARALVQEGLVSARQCIASGLSAQQACEAVTRGAWRRLARGVYDVSPVLELPAMDALHRERRRAAILGPLALTGSVATGLCALVLHGVQGAPVTIRSEVTFPTGTPRRSTAPVRLRRIAVAEWVEIDGLRCATVTEALAQAVPASSRRHAVALMDSARHLGLLSVPDLERAHARARRRPGVQHTHDWWLESDALAESPAETWARLACGDAGCPPDARQLKVFTVDGRFLARVDLAWRLPDGRWLLVEIDGTAVHEAPAALFADRGRQNAISTERTLLRRYTGKEAWTGSFVPEVAGILATARWSPGRPAPDRLYL